MSFQIDDPTTSEAVRELARKTGRTPSEAIHLAVVETLARLGGDERNLAARPLIPAIRDLQEELARYPRTGLDADKSFFDTLSGET